MANKKSKKVVIYIDGSNLYYKLKDFNTPNTTYFDYKGFCEFLARGRDINGVRYYVGTVRVKNSKDEWRRKNQQKLFEHLKSQDITIKKGHIMENNSTYHEKGVDVKLAVELIIGAYENYYDTAIVISSDTDLIPAIKHVRSMGKNVEYVGFAHQPSYGMQKASTLSNLILEDEIEPFVQRTLLD